MPLPHTPLWQEIYAQENRVLVIRHAQPQVWSSYLSLWALASQGGTHLVIVRGYEKEAFYRAAKNWLAPLGIDSFLRKDGISLGTWGNLYIIHPYFVRGLIAEARTITITSPYAFKEDYYRLLRNTMSASSPFWVFHPKKPPVLKGEGSLRNQPFLRLSWHHRLHVFNILRRPSQDFDKGVFTYIWKHRLIEQANSASLVIEKYLKNIPPKDDLDLDHFEFF